MELTGFLLYLLAVGAAWLFRLGYLGWFGPFLLWAVILIPPALALLSLPALLRISLSLEVPAHVTRHENAQIRLLFHSRSRFPAGKVVLRLSVFNHFTGKAEQMTYRFDAVGDCVGELPIPTADCGALSIKADRCRCHDVIGLIRLKLPAPKPQLCVVLPIPAEPESAVRSEAELDVQPRMKPKYGGGFAEDHELRPYLPGDMINSIHWKLSSKTEDLIVREPIVPENRTVYVIVHPDELPERGLQSLYWLSRWLNDREQPHTIVARDLFPVTDESGTIAALRTVLSAPPAQPVAVSFPDARVLYEIRGGEVTVT